MLPRQKTMTAATDIIMITSGTANCQAYINHSSIDQCSIVASSMESVRGLVDARWCDAKLLWSCTCVVLCSSIRKINLCSIGCIDKLGSNIGYFRMIQNDSEWDYLKTLPVSLHILFHIVSICFLEKPPIFRESHMNPPAAGWDWWDDHHDQGGPDGCNEKRGAWASGHRFFHVFFMLLKQ